MTTLWLISIVFIVPWSLAEWAFYYVLGGPILHYHLIFPKKPPEAGILLCPIWQQRKWVWERWRCPRTGAHSWVPSASQGLGLWGNRIKLYFKFSNKNVNGCLPWCSKHLEMGMNGAGALRKARGALLAQERNLWQCEWSALYFVRLDFCVFPLTSLKDSIGHLGGWSRPLLACLFAVGGLASPGTEYSVDNSQG